MKQPQDYHFLSGVCRCVFQPGFLSRGALSYYTLGILFSFFYYFKHWVPRGCRSTLQSLPAVSLKWWAEGFMWSLKIYRVVDIHCILGRRILKNKINYLSTGKLFILKNVTAPMCFIATVQGDYLPSLTGNVWLVFSNYLDYTGSWGENQKTEMERWIK